jgi:DNA-binding response OmpR family regulator
MSPSAILLVTLVACLSVGFLVSTILVCDDDDLLVELLRFKLEQRGYSVLRAENGKSGLEITNSHKPDLIVLDAMMPVMSGFEVLSALKSDMDTCDIPVLMLTARRQEKDILAGLKLGARDYLIKPFIPEELLVRIEAILGSNGRPYAETA